MTENDDPSDQGAPEPGFPEIRRKAVRYWERRRIIYNLVLIPPTIVSYCFGGIVRGHGHEPPFASLYAVFLVLMCAVGANIFYSFVYALEFLLWSDDPQSDWNLMGRPLALLGGLALGVVLACIGGYDVALIALSQRTGWAE